MHEPAQRPDKILQRFLAAIRTRYLSFPAGRVREQVPDGHVAADRLVLHVKIRQIRPDRRAEIDLALLDQAHHHRRRERLGNGGNGEHRVRRDGQRILDARDPEPSHRDATTVDDAESHAGHMVLAHF